MQRRQNRQRRDYLYRRALLLRDAEISEKRAKLRESLATGKPLDRAIANDQQLRKDYAYDETSADIKDQLDLDDECAYISRITFSLWICDPVDAATTQSKQYEMRLDHVFFY